MAAEDSATPAISALGVTKRGRAQFENRGKMHTRMKEIILLLSSKRCAQVHVGFRCPNVLCYEIEIARALQHRKRFVVPLRCVITLSESASVPQEVVPWCSTGAISCEPAHASCCGRYSCARELAASWLSAAGK